MNDRPTKEIKLSTGEVAVVYEYATGGDIMTSDRVMADAAKINGKDVNIDAAEAYQDYTKKRIELIVVKVGENTDVWDAIVSMRAKDYMLIARHVSDVFDGIATEEAGK